MTDLQAEAGERRSLVAMKNIPLHKMGKVLINGRMVDQVQPVQDAKGKQQTIRVGVIFQSLDQAKSIMSCSSEDVADLVRRGALQWRDKELATRLLNTPAGRAGNNTPTMVLQSEVLPPGDSSESGTEISNATLVSGANLSWPAAFLNDKSEDWLRTELNSQRPKMDVERMDASQLREILSSNAAK